MRKLIPFSSTTKKNTKTKSSHYKIEETEEKSPKSPKKDIQRQNNNKRYTNQR